MWPISCATTFLGTPCGAPTTRRCDGASASSRSASLGVARWEHPALQHVVGRIGLAGPRDEQQRVGLRVLREVSPLRQQLDRRIGQGKPAGGECPVPVSRPGASHWRSATGTVRFGATSDASSDPSRPERPSSGRTSSWHSFLKRDRWPPASNGLKSRRPPGHTRSELCYPSSPGRPMSATSRSGRSFAARSIASGTLDTATGRPPAASSILTVSSRRRHDLRQRRCSAPPGRQT